VPTLVAPRVAGLTTNHAPFIEDARSHGELYIEQPYDLYTAENHESWRRLYARMAPQWERYANPHFLKGIRRWSEAGSRAPARRSESIPEPVDRVSRERPSAATFRHSCFSIACAIANFQRRLRFANQESGLLPEPDIFHDIAGHVPSHTDRHFADTLVRFGECAHTAAEIVSGIRDESERVRNADQHHQSDGSVLLVHDRVRIDEIGRRIEGLRQRATSARMARSRTPLNLPTCSDSRFSSNGRSIRGSRSITINRCCSSSTRSITCSACGQAGVVDEQHRLIVIDLEPLIDRPFELNRESLHVGDSMACAISPYELSSPLPIDLQSVGRFHQSELDREPEEPSHRF